MASFFRHIYNTKYEIVQQKPWQVVIDIAYCHYLTNYLFEDKLDIDDILFLRKKYVSYIFWLRLWEMAQFKLTDQSYLMPTVFFDRF